jgi:hypothetical protein
VKPRFWLLAERKATASPADPLLPAQPAPGASSVSAGSVAETAVAARRRVQLVDLFEHAVCDGTDDELCDSLAGLDSNRLSRKVDQQDRDLAAIVRIDRSRGVRDAEALPEREPAARANLTLVSAGDRNRKPAWNKASLAGSEVERRIDGGRKVHPDGAVGHCTRKLDAHVADAANGNPQRLTGA